MSDLDEYAAHGKSLREHDARQQPRRQGRTRRRLSDSERRIRDALSGDVSLTLLVLSIGAVGGGFGLYALLRRGLASPGPELAGVALGTVVAAIGFVVWQRAVAARVERERKWLQALPFAADWTEYQRALGQSRFTTTVQVRARFATEIESAQRTRLADAARGLVSASSTTCSARTLALSTSKPLKTHFRGNGDRDSRFSNRSVHAWVRASLQGLARIHDEHAIESVEIEVS